MENSIKNFVGFLEKGYDPFGMVLVGRNWSVGSEYRYGFNGKESDQETYGEGNIYDYGFRIYNPRLGRFLSVDPLTTYYSMLTPYQFASNQPIWGVDLDGLELRVVIYEKAMESGKIVFKESKSIDMLMNPGPLGKGYLFLYPQENNQFTYKYLNSQTDKNGKSDLHQYSGEYTFSIIGPSPLELGGLYDQIAKQITDSNEGSPLGNNSAQNLLLSENVTFSTEHSGPEPGFSRNDLANADDNIADAAAGRPAFTSPYGHLGEVQVLISTTMLDALYELSQTYTFNISEMTGGLHGGGSRHYSGIAVDINYINGIRVGTSNPYYKQFMEDAKNLGATEVIGPPSENHGTHVHLAWPRSEVQTQVEN